MPLQYSAAPSSRIRKPKTTPQSSLKQSPFARHPRVKPFSQSRPQTSARSKQSLKENNIEDIDGENNFSYGDILPDIGVSDYISRTIAIDNVVQAIQYVCNTMFSDLPQSRPGMNSTRIAEVLNFRRSLPPIVSVAHVHMLLNAPTKVEKELVQLVDSAVVRRLYIPGRGSSVAGLGDCVILVEDWEEMIRNTSMLDKSLKGTFIPISIFFYEFGSYRLNNNNFFCR